ncbi:MAG: CopG family transcriptional regulator [Oscillospiraceae bacterium]|jgi:metal-responsive CopG/Arc/MetJ family transcriptional regulator|nr:CopG family transcriptional regulator [Oscillospiraceae bacterium]
MAMERRKIKISKKGDDGYKVISVRIREGTLETIDGISKQTNRSRNEVINILLENAAGDIEIEE